MAFSLWQPLRSDLTKGNTRGLTGSYTKIQYPALLRESVPFAGKSPAARKVAGRSRYLPSGIMLHRPKIDSLPTVPRPLTARGVSLGALPSRWPATIGSVTAEGTFRCISTRGRLASDPGQPAGPASGRGH